MKRKSIKKSCIISLFLLLTILIVTLTNALSQYRIIGKAVQIDLLHEWTDSGIHISAGDTVIMNSFGAFCPWSYGDLWFDMSRSDHGSGNSIFTAPNFPIDCVIARIGETDTLIAAGFNWFIAESSGNLFFTINDEKANYHDNLGTVIVEVKIVRKTGVSSYQTIDKNIPNDFQLKQNYPNPFNPSTTIEYAIQQPGMVQLEIYNSLGQVIRKLVDEEKLAGYYSVIWDGRDDYNEPVTSGAYFYRIINGDLVSKKKMLMLR